VTNMKEIRQILFAFILIALSKFLYCQVDNSIFSCPVPQLQHEPHLLYFHFDNLNFFKNNEYFNKTEEGKTLIGYYFTPTLDFYVSDKTMIRGGVNLLKYSGTSGFGKFQPVFSIYHALSKNFCLVFGSLESSLFHVLPEPMFSFDRLIEHHLENGLQFIFNDTIIYSDTWLNWEKFIVDNDHEQERFTAGTSERFRIIKINNLDISLPVAITFKHRGGQVNKSGKTIQTITNSFTGLSFEYHPPDCAGRINSLNFDCNLYGFKDLSPNHELPFTEGYATYITAGMRTNCINISAGYWNVWHYYSPLGEPLFQSVSLITPHYTDNNKILATGKIHYQKMILKKCAIILRFESYYDMGNDIFDFSYSMYLKINTEIFLKRITNN